MSRRPTTRVVYPRTQSLKSRVGEASSWRPFATAMEPPNSPAGVLRGVLQETTNTLRITPTHNGHPQTAQKQSSAAGNHPRCRRSTPKLQARNQPASSPSTTPTRAFAHRRLVPSTASRLPHHVPTPQHGLGQLSPARTFAVYDDSSVASPDICVEARAALSSNADYFAETFSPESALDVGPVKALPTRAKQARSVGGPVAAAPASPRASRGFEGFVEVREAVLRELVSTESTYVASLEVLEVVYRQPLVAGACVGVSPAVSQQCQAHILLADSLPS